MLGTTCSVSEAVGGKEGWGWGNESGDHTERCAPHCASSGRFPAVLNVIYDR